VGYVMRDNFSNKKKTAFLVQTFFYWGILTLEVVQL
jgi:hypothetical protein